METVTFFKIKAFVAKGIKTRVATDDQEQLKDYK